MDVYIDGKIANKRLVTSERNERKARAYIRQNYGNVKVERVRYGDSVALYWVTPKTSTFVHAEEKGREEARRTRKTSSRDASKGTGTDMAGRMLKKLISHRKKRRSRDWKGNPKGHATAARKGWKDSAKAGWKPKRSSKKRSSAKKKSKRDPSRDWKGEPRRHAKAAAYGWHEHARTGWRPKRMSYTGVLASTAKKRKKKRARRDY